MNATAPRAKPESNEQKKEYGKINERPFVVFDEGKSTTPFERWIEARAREKMGEHGTKMGLFIATLFSNLPYMPAFVNSKFGASGRSGEDCTMVCCFSRKKSRNDCRISADFMGNYE